MAGDVQSLFLTSMKQWKLVVVLLTFWLAVVLYMTNSVPGGADSSSRTERSLARALEELDLLHRQNKELQQLMEDYRQKQSVTQDHGDTDAIRSLEARLQKAHEELSRLAEKSSKGLSYEQEHARRKVENTARELWFFLQAQLSKLDQSAKVTKLKNSLDGYRRTMVDDFAKLRIADGSDKRRAESSMELGDLVQRRLQYLQNPADCSVAKKIVCNLLKGCGFGCQLHHVTYCLIAAYATKRTLILESKGWRYATGGWETVFQPLSSNCRYKGQGSKARWGISEKEMDKHQIIELPIVDSLHPPPDFMPLAVPADLAHDLSVFHGDPGVWWIGQMVSYLIRPNKHLKTDLDVAGKRMGFKNIIVGVHVRRTDKINLEAAFHSIEEYMTHVAEFYDQLERTQPVTTRRVYLATDDSTLLTEAKDKYPSYKFISDNTISKSASLGTRYTDGSLRGVLIDIHFLSRCDFLVCTFSSQVCRVAYELMQTLHGDASRSFRSLDDVFYYGGQNAHDMKVLESHAADDDGVIDMTVGDAVGIAGNHWDGFSKGLNRRTGVSGLYPSYKVENTVVAISMPTYPEVPRKRS